MALRRGKARNDYRRWRAEALLWKSEALQRTQELAVLAQEVRDCREKLERSRAVGVRLCQVLLAQNGDPEEVARTVLGERGVGP